MNEYIKFYYHALPSERKSIYKELYIGFKRRSDAIEIHTDTNNVSPEDIAYIARLVYNDAPSFYYLDMTHYSYIKTQSGYIYSQNYIYSDETIRAFNRQLVEKINMFLSKYISTDMTEYQKEKAVHDYLVKTVVYDNDALNSEEYIHEAYNVIGPLLKKRAVCWGIACAFKLLCDYCQIKSFVATGDTLPLDGDAGHAWNIVNIDKKSFHVDVTWDIKCKGDISFCYDYFNLNDRLIRLDHTWDSKLYPKCDSIEHNYYYKNHLYVKNVNDLTLYIADRLKAGQRYIAVKFVARMPSVSLVEDAIRSGFQKAKKYGEYKYYISVKTHNIYIETA